MNLKDIFKNAPDMQIEQLSTDSRLPMRNAIFFCLDGIKYDGHDYINQAIENGARVIIYSKELQNKKSAVYIKVKDVNDALIKIAEVFYNHPNQGLTKFIVNGCYGRSSVSSFINHYLNKVSKCGTIGSFGINYLDKHLDIAFPALTPLENVKVMDNLKKNAVNNVVFETSTISLFYKKLDVIKPNVFIYTNTSKYCSDYRVCNGSYYEYIRKYLYTLEDSTCVLLNGDDDSYNELNESINNYYTYGQNEFCDYQISNIDIQRKYTSFNLKFEDKTYKVFTKLISLSNVYNLVAAIAALNITGYSIDDIIEKLQDIDYVDGVMELNDDANIIIDCGYELDSIVSSLDYAKNTSIGRNIGIIGINYSDNDERIKNIIRICEKYLDLIILTEDETLQGEVQNILSRCDKFITKNNVLKISFRSIAIENAINIMNKDDTLLILGKGNEKYLSMGLGKEKYLGDKYYVNKYIRKRKDEQNETI